MKLQIVKYCLAVAAFLGLGFMGPKISLGTAQEMTELQQKMRQMEQTSQKNNQDVAKAMNLLTQIQTQFQSIKGQIDASKFMSQETDRVYQDLDLRVSSLEDKIDQIHKLLSEIAAAQKAGKPVPDSTNSQEYSDYQALIAMVNARDYRSAASGFMGFQRKYSNSEWNPRAQYWVGECFYSMGDYAKAIREFQTLVTKYPQDKRVKEAIYKQGLSFSRLKQDAQAKLFFQKVMADYPNSAEAAKAQTRLHRIEQKEQNQVALGDSSEKPSTQPKERPEVSADRPIMKPAPYPHPKTGTPPPTESPKPKPEGSEERPADTQGGGAPLF